MYSVGWELAHQKAFIAFHSLALASALWLCSVPCSPSQQNTLIRLPNCKLVFLYIYICLYIYIYIYLLLCLLYMFVKGKNENEHCWFNGCATEVWYCVDVNCQFKCRYKKDINLTPFLSQSDFILSAARLKLQDMRQVLTI